MPALVLVALALRLAAMITLSFRGKTYAIGVGRSSEPLKNIPVLGLLNGYGMIRNKPARITPEN
jgi:hypothetical protein